jgi:A/G-specific adenine glycosylase
VVAEHGGKFPASIDGLRTLPGIGPYTAGAIGAIAFDIPAAAVDGNVERVIPRFYGIEDPLPGCKPLIRTLTEALVPEKRAGDFAQAVMDLGSLICTPKSPSCLICPWNGGCVARAKGMQTELPRKAKKKAVPTRRAHVYWISNAEGEVLIRQRPMKGLLAGMSEFPSSDWTPDAQEFAAPFNASWKRVSGTVEHTFTHFHFEMTVWHATSTDAVLNGRFVPIATLQDEALPSVMRKVAAHVLKSTS